MSIPRKLVFQSSGIFCLVVLLFVVFGCEMQQGQLVIVLGKLIIFTEF